MELHEQNTFGDVGKCIKYDIYGYDMRDCLFYFFNLKYNSFMCYLLSKYFFLNNLYQPGNDKFGSPL